MKRTAAPSILIAVILFTVAVIAEAQQPQKVARIGYLSALNPATESTRSEAIRLALRELGYVEGQNIAIEYRYGQGKLDRYPELAGELVRLIRSADFQFFFALPVRTKLYCGRQSSKVNNACSKIR